MCNIDAIHLTSHLNGFKMKKYGVSAMNDVMLPTTWCLINTEIIHIILQKITIIMYILIIKMVTGMEGGMAKCHPEG